MEADVNLLHNCELEAFKRKRSRLMTKVYETTKAELRLQGLDDVVRTTSGIWKTIQTFLEIHMYAHTIIMSLTLSDNAAMTVNILVNTQKFPTLNRSYLSCPTTMNS